MSDQNKGIAPQGSGDKKMIFAMASIGIICALLIVVTYEGTKGTIENNRAKALEDAVFQVIPGITKTKTFQLNPQVTVGRIGVGWNALHIVRSKVTPDCAGKRVPLGPDTRSAPR